MNCTSVTSYAECYTPENWNFPNITRPFSILYYVLGGTAFYSIDGEEHRFEQGHLYILPVNRQFSLWEDPQDKFYALYVHAYTSPEIEQVLTLRVQEDPFLFDLLQLMRRYAAQQKALPMQKLTDTLPDTICLRYNPGGSFSLGNTIMDMPGDAKYGMTEDQMAGAMIRLQKLGVKHFGIHSFLASNTTTNEYYPALAAKLFRLAVRLRNATGAHIAFVNLSGGVGVDYRPEQPKCDIFAIGEGVRRGYEQILTPEGMDDVAIYAELGRFMLAPYGHLIAKVLHKKHIYREYVGLDACAADLMRPAIYGAYHHITVLGKEDAMLDHVYDVTGGLCENNDKFAIERSLPKVEIGDLLAIHDTGAHGHAMGYNYNGKLRSAEVLLRPDGSYQLIRRAETSRDYFATLDFTEFPLG